MRSSGVAVLAVISCVGWAAQADVVQRAETVQLAQANGNTVVLAQQGGVKALPSPNDVFTLVQNVGPWRILKVYRDNKFHRCRAELGSGANQLLVVKWATRNWGIAIANSKNLAPRSRHRMEMEIGRASEVVDGQVDVFGLYLSKTVPQGTIDSLRTASRFQMTSPMGTQSWNLTNTSAMVGGLEDCFNANVGNAPGGTNAGKPGSYKEVFTRVGNVAGWSIVKVYRNNRFHRCRAELGKGVQQTNVVKWATRQWGLSLAARGLKAGSRHQMDVDIGRSSEILNGLVDDKGSNLTANLTESLVSGLRSSSRLQIKTPSNNQSYNLNSVSSAIGAVEDCFNANIGNM